MTKLYSCNGSNQIKFPVVCTWFLFSVSSQTVSFLVVKADAQSVILVGTVSNVERNIVSDLRRVIKALSDMKLVKVILIESDSKDSTRLILGQLQREIENLIVISLGDLRERLPNRIERIRFCRQRYVLEVRRLITQSPTDLVAVADLDGMNSKLNSVSVASCFIRDDWDVVTANQKFGYYDLLALRHPTWCPDDIMKLLSEKQQELRLQLASRRHNLNRISVRARFDSIRKDVIYSKMHRIKSDSPWIEVESAFGGFAFYKSWIFQEFDYEPAISESEHVLFHRKIRERSGKIFINPALINNHINTYNINRFTLIRQARDLLWNSKIYGLVKG